MPNKDYYKKMGVSFADALKEYDDKKYSTVDVWLNSERIFKHKFKCGDIVFSEKWNTKFLITKIYYDCVDDWYEGVSIQRFGNGEIDLNEFRLQIDLCDKHYKKVGHC